jgi:hypothetical protein
VQKPENGAPSLRTRLWQKPPRPPCRLNSSRPGDGKARIARIVDGAPFANSTQERTTSLPGKSAQCAAKIGA